MTGFRRLSRALATTEEGSLWFECPGCEMVHRIMHGLGPEPRWGWNGNLERPTFTPSVLVRYSFCGRDEPGCGRGQDSREREVSGRINQAIFSRWSAYTARVAGIGLGLVQ